MGALDDLEARIGEIKTRLRQIDAEADGQPFTDEQRSEWNTLNTELEDARKTKEELEARMARIAELSETEGAVERERPDAPRARVRKRVPEDPTDIHAYRKYAVDMDDLSRGYQEGAMRLVDRMAPAVDNADKEATQERLEKLLKTVDSQDRELARRIIITGGETYERAFGKYISGRTRTAAEQDALERALSLTTTAGGYAVPYTLDPTVILTAAGQINPIRRLAQVRTITGNTWYGVSSTGISASYGAEATEASDNAPTLVQPSANVEKAQAFIPFSIEIGQDWGNMQAEMAMLFAEAKDTLENTQFLTGLGHGSNAPQGLIAVGGATAVVSTATTAVFAVADLYSLELALSPRFRQRAQIVANKAAFQKVRQFDTYGGANLWTQLSFSDPPQLLGYPAHEWSAYSSAVTTSGSTIMTIGDFSKFMIVDRVGMDVELVPHLFATANNRPSGQRGLYAYWRNTSTVLTPGLQANSAFVSLKVL